MGGSLAAPRTHLHWRRLTKRGQNITLIPRLIGSIYNNIGPASLTALHYHPLYWLSLISSCFSAGYHWFLAVSTMVCFVPRADAPTNPHPVANPQIHIQNKSEIEFLSDFSSN